MLFFMNLGESIKKTPVNKFYVDFTEKKTLTSGDIYALFGRLDCLSHLNV